MENRKDGRLKFHWRLLQGEEGWSQSIARQHEIAQTSLPDIEAQLEFCQLAEEMEIDALLVDFSYGKPDPILLSTALALQTEKIKFIIAIRSGLMSPTLFAQQVNTFSTLISGDRVTLNVFTGDYPKEQRYYGDFLSHDERSACTEEFMAICNAFWDNNGVVNYNGNYFQVENGKLSTPFRSEGYSRPYTFISGGSEAAKKLTINTGHCWMRFADVPQKLVDSIQPILDAGKDVGLRLCAIARSTRKEAIEAANNLIKNFIDNYPQDAKGKVGDFFQENDSVSIKDIYEYSANEWLSDHLWSGALAFLGPSCIALVGSYEEVASAFIQYKEIGITHFILSGWPQQSAMISFGKYVLPLVREMEH
ncbi:MAG: LLM class flavin-dependent oxidoreductase [Hormoscilla sp. GUM202]|nr:LLM class flavin-dependent oxidoreductase [Hormoscilla sp. GUM202]